ncbi:MAG: hypothetical protein J7K20_07385, partial [Thermodesulfobacterium sp.]|nr:hypothetical protein [Thermodesulfobacterium sp.]
EDAITFAINFYKEEFSLNPSKTFKEIMEIFKSAEDPFLRNKIARELSFHLGIPENEIFKSFIKNIAEIEPIKDREEGYDKAEACLKMIAQFLINYPEYYNELESSGLSKLLDFYSTKFYGRFLKYLSEEFKRGNMEIDYIPDLEFQEVLSDLLLNPPFENKEEVLQQIKEFIKKELARREIKTLTGSLKNLEVKGLKEEIEKHLWVLKKSLNDKLVEETEKNKGGGI